MIDEGGKASASRQHKLTVHLQQLTKIKGINDPSAGSPTETLLRLLLPLNDKVRASSRQTKEWKPN